MTDTALHRFSDLIAGTNFREPLDPQTAAERLGHRRDYGNALMQRLIKTMGPQSNSEVDWPRVGKAIREHVARHRITIRQCAESLDWPSAELHRAAQGGKLTCAQMHEICTMMEVHPRMFWIAPGKGRK